MSYSNYFDYYPTLGERVYKADGAKVIGRAELGDHVNIWFNTVVRADVNFIKIGKNTNINIWFNTVVRADVNFIKIGKNTNIQDLCMLHVTEDNSLTIGENTSLGHSVILHGCKIGNGCLIGMGAIILDGAVIGNNCLVAAGSLVSPGKVFPDGSMIKGRPAVVERALSEAEIDKISNHYKSYVNYKEQYLKMDETNGTSQKKISDKA